MNVYATYDTCSQDLQTHFLLLFCLFETTTVDLNAILILLILEVKRCENGTCLQYVNFRCAEVRTRPHPPLEASPLTRRGLRRESFERELWLSITRRHYSTNLTLLHPLLLSCAFPSRRRRILLPPLPVIAVAEHDCLPPQLRVALAARHLARV